MKLPEATKNRIKNDVGDYLIESIVSVVGKAKSPVSGGDWEKQLSPEYKKKKASEGLPGIANLELEGDLLDALTYESTDEGIEIGWFGDQAAKADGHNNFSGKSSLPRRQALPDVDQEFIPAIQKEIEKIIADAIADGVEPVESDFDSVTTKEELYDTLSEYFPGLSRAEIRSAISRSPNFAAFLDDNSLMGLL